MKPMILISEPLDPAEDDCSCSDSGLGMLYIAQDAPDVELQASRQSQQTLQVTECESLVRRVDSLTLI